MAGKSTKDENHRDADAGAASGEQAFGDEAAEQAAFAELEQGASEERAEMAEELEAERERVLRLRAEMENLRSRTSRELADERRYASLALARDILPVVDNIDRAIEAAETRGDAGDLIEGFRMVRQQLLTALRQHQCVPLEAEGAPFDPQVHEAILQQPSDQAPAGHVLLVTQTGYQLNDRIVRPAQVIVSSGPAADPPQG